MCTNSKDIKSFLELAWHERDTIVPLLLGDPGIGKTQMIYRFAEKHNANVVEIIASQILPTEVSGIAMPDSDTKTLSIYDHVRLSSLQDGDILFLDELFQASPQVLSAMLTLIEDRRMMSGKKLPDIMIVAAANPLGSVDAVPLPIRQRFMILNVNWDSDAWVEWINKSLNIKIDKNLVGQIETSGHKYNVLTPRTCTKLLKMCRDAQNNDALDTAFSFIDNMFGDKIILKGFKKTFNSLLTPVQKMIKALDEIRYWEDAMCGLGTTIDGDGKRLVWFYTNDAGGDVDWVSGNLYEMNELQFQEAVEHLPAWNKSKIMEILNTVDEEDY